MAHITIPITVYDHIPISTGIPFFTSISFKSDGTTEFSALTSGHVVLGPESSCERSLTFTITVTFFNQVVDESSMTVTTACTFLFSNGALTLNYIDGNVDTGSIAGSTLTITRGGSVWVFRK